MSMVSTSDWTVADLLSHFGPIAHRRIRQQPAPGHATERDVVEIHAHEKRLYELVDGVLVEKTMGVQESYLALLLGQLLQAFVTRHDLGFVLGSDGMAKLAPGLVRIPDVSFVAWDQLPARHVPRLAMLEFAPALAVEVLSPGNTPQEMERKRIDYFTSGVRLLWYIDPVTRMVQVFTSQEKSTLLTESDVLTGEPVLPDFVLPLRDLFARLEPQGS